MQGQAQWAYNDSLAELSGPDVALTPSWRIRMYEEAGELAGRSL